MEVPPSKINFRITVTLQKLILVNNTPQKFTSLRDIARGGVSPPHSSLVGISAIQPWKQIKKEGEKQGGGNVYCSCVLHQK